MAALLAGAIAVLVITVLILQSETVARFCVYLAGAVIFGIFVKLIVASNRDERAGLIAAFVLVVQSVFFFIFYQQMATSLNLFAQRNVDLDFSIFGLHLFTWIPEQYQDLNSIWIVILSPVLVFIYNGLGRFGKDPSISAKFAWGFAAVAIGFFIYGVGSRWAVNGQVSSWTMVWGYGLYSLGELLVSGLGLAMIARYVPDRMGGFMMGAYFLASGLSQYLGSVVANFAHIPEGLKDPVESLSIYTRLFNELGFTGIGLHGDCHRHVATDEKTFDQPCAYRGRKAMSTANQNAKRHPHRHRPPGDAGSRPAAGFFGTGAGPGRFPHRTRRGTVPPVICAARTGSRSTMMTPATWTSFPWRNPCQARIPDCWSPSPTSMQR